MRIIGVNATNISSGGGLNHLIHFFANLNRNNCKGISFIVWGQESILNQLKSHSFVQKKTNKYINSNPLIRSAWVFLYLKNEIVYNRCTVLFTPGGNDITRYNNVVVMSRNMLPFELLVLLKHNDLLMLIKMIFIRILTLINFRLSNGIIFLNEYARNNIPIKVSNIASVVIPHGVEKKLFKKKKFNFDSFNAQNPMKIIYPSTFFKYKNHKLILKALDGLNDNLHLEIIFVGSFKTLNKNLKATLKRWKKNNTKLFLMDHKSHIELNNLYNNADIGLFASKCENMPNILLEMMAKALPIISSDYGANICTIGEDNLFFHRDDPISLRDKIIECYNNPKLLNHLASSNYERSKMFDWSKTTLQTLNFLVSRSRNV